MTPSKAPIIKKKEKLFALMVERFIPGKGWYPEGIRYMHAESAYKAKATFLAASGIYKRISSVHPGTPGLSEIIAYKVQDKKGLILSV
jgi:hypothetical protein